MKSLALFFIVTAGLAVAQEQAFWTKEQIIGQSANAGMRAWDIAQSCAHPNYREIGGPWQSCAGISGWVSLGIPASIGSAYMAHRMHHDKLAKWMPWLWAAGSAGSIALSYHSYTMPSRARR